MTTTMHAIKTSQSRTDFWDCFKDDFRMYQGRGARELMTSEVACLRPQTSNATRVSGKLCAQPDRINGESGFCRFLSTSSEVSRLNAAAARPDSRPAFTAEHSVFGGATTCLSASQSPTTGSDRVSDDDSASKRTRGIMMVPSTSLASTI